MISICKHTRRRHNKESTLAFVWKNAIIALTLAILFGLGWGLGLAASGTPSEEATFILQLLFTIFVGCQGILIFVLHGVRKAEVRGEWKKWLSKAMCRTYCLHSTKLDSTASPSRSYVTSPSNLKVVSKTGTLPTDASFEMYSNQLKADTTIAGGHTSTANDSDI